MTTHAKDFFFLKTDDWTSEHEYRVVFESASDLYLKALVSSRFVGFGSSLMYVIVGERFPAWQLPGAKSAAAARGSELRRMTWEAGQPFPGAVT